ncbi:MAG: helix-turn-helix domain-containing protein [Conexibacter sp.]
MPELLIPRLKREIEARLAELRPIVAEVEQLKAARRALLEDMAPARTRLSAARPRMLAAPAAEPAERSARNGAETTNGSGVRNTTRDVILALVEERPGVSVAEIVAVTKLAKPTVATTVSKLKREGVLADEAGGVKLASRQPVTLAQIASVPEREAVSDEEWEAARPGASTDAAA